MDAVPVVVIKEQPLKDDISLLSKETPPHVNAVLGNLRWRHYRDKRCVLNRHVGHVQNPLRPANPASKTRPRLNVAEDIIVKRIRLRIRKAGDGSPRDVKHHPII